EPRRRGPIRGPRRRGALVAGIGTLGAAVVAVVVLVTTSLASGHSPSGGRTATSLSSAANVPPPGGFGTIPAESGTPHAGTVRFAESPGGSPTWILPLATAGDNWIPNVLQFDYEMWRPLYWPAEGTSRGIDPTMSLAKPPVWSNGDKTVTITMNPRYKWSDGKPVSAQDVAFDIDLIKAAVAENPGKWGGYIPGSFPDDLAGLSTPDASTVVLSLKSAVSPMWFYEDELAALQPMPAHAWAKAAAGGSVLDFSNPANAKKIYDYLAAQSEALSTWATNPLWRLVDGPYRLTSFNASGTETMTANPGYGGPASHEIKVLDGVPFHTDAAEFSALKTGSIDVGYVPSGDVTQAARLRSAGYDVFGYPAFGWAFAPYNFKDGTGDFDHIAAQLYFRQAMAHLQNQQDYVSSFMHGAGSPNYGPIPPLPASQYTPGNANDTYPFSLATARSLLAGHGWKVIPDGTDTCVRPGSGPGQCGAGIPAGTRLAFNLIYNSETPPIGQEVSALTSEAKQAGITITLTTSTFDEIIDIDDNPAAPANENKWAMEDFGGYRDANYPTTYTVFNTQGVNNFGSYSDPQADQLINASISGTDPNAVRNEAAYLTAQQPGLFQPNQDQVYAWSKTLSGPLDSFANLTQSYFTPELWYFTS
ncbi:MAG: ABC transporter substrate-binding protein, partial [Streptosporangiales bacterium]